MFFPFTRTFEEKRNSIWMKNRRRQKISWTHILISTKLVCAEKSKHWKDEQKWDYQSFFLDFYWDFENSIYLRSDFQNTFCVFMFHFCFAVNIVSYGFAPSSNLDSSHFIFESTSFSWKGQRDGNFLREYLAILKSEFPFWFAIYVDSNLNESFPHSVLIFLSRLHWT